MAGYAVVTGMGRYEEVVEKPFSIVEPDGIYRVSARRRYPWNGKVDIRFDSVGKQYTVSLVAKDIVGGTNIAIRTVYPEFATSFFEKRGLSQCSRGSREKSAIIFSTYISERLDA